jgi:hypothetical protein
VLFRRTVFKFVITGPLAAVHAIRTVDRRGLQTHVCAHAVALASPGSTRVPALAPSQSSVRIPGRFLRFLVSAENR